MAILRVIKMDSFKKGDTPVFEFNFSAPFDGFSWTGVVADMALTNVSAPTNNAGAGMVRTGISVTDNGDGTGTVSEQITAVESAALVVSPYKIEVQLKDGGGANIATAATGKLTVVQDYVI